MHTQRIRGRKLQAIRARWFQQAPLCVTCMAEGRVSLATELDHIVALVNGGSDDDTNRQGLCHDCHDKKTAIDLGKTTRLKFGIDGYPIEGQQ